MPEHSFLTIVKSGICSEDLGFIPLRVPAGAMLSLWIIAI